MIRITSKYNGFIRCGVRHPATPTEYAEGHFSDEQMAILEAEPMLMVQRVNVQVLPDVAYYNEAEFRALAFETAQKIAFDHYGVKGRSWDGLWEEFSAAQEVIRG